MIVDGQMGIDPSGDAGAGPKVDRESGCFRPSEGLFFQFSFFSVVEFGWTTRGWFCLEGFGPWAEKDAFHRRTLGRSTFSFLATLTGGRPSLRRPIARYLRRSGTFELPVGLITYLQPRV